jgi:hypothetical protein
MVFEEIWEILKRRYYIVMLAVAIAISSIIAYCFFIPKTQTFKVEIDYSAGFDLVQFQNELYRRGSVMHIIDSPSRQSVQLRKGVSVVLRLLDNPSNVTQEWYLCYNFIFLNGGEVLGDVACKQIRLDDPPRFVIPEDGYYVFELGVVNVDSYDPRNSIGVWAFSVTVIPP